MKKLNQLATLTGLSITQLVAIFIFENLPTFRTHSKTFFDLFNKRFFSNSNALRKGKGSGQSKRYDQDGLIFGLMLYNVE